MPRTTAEKVGALVEIDDERFPDMEPFISTANELVTEFCGDSGYTATRLELIERWLAAHFYAVADPMPTYEQAGSVAAKYESRVDLGLSLTRFGQQAMVLDSAKGLASVDVGRVRRTARTRWLGTGDSGCDPGVELED